MEDASSLAEAILEQIADAVIFADATGTIMRWNHAAAALFGYSAAEALGPNLDLIIPEHLRAAHWRGFEMTFALVQGQAGGPARGAVAVARDVTERTEQQQADARRDRPG